MNIPFALTKGRVRAADLSETGEAERVERFVAERGGSVFQRPAWLMAIERGTGQNACALVAEKGGAITGWLPLTRLHSPFFGRALVSSGFAVDGGILADTDETGRLLALAAQEQAQRLSCSAVELRGGYLPEGWVHREDSHCGFVADLAASDEAQLAAIPRKQRAEIRKSLRADLEIAIGQDETLRAEHYAVYAESVHNLGTPVFPRALFDAVLDTLESDILVVRENGRAISAVLSLYHRGHVMPYWGGGTRRARLLRSNDRMYFELMLHARKRGCTGFDFGRSKTGSGPFFYKKTWGFAPRSLRYAAWTAPGSPPRNADPASPKHAARIAAWQRLPLGLANRIGPLISRGLG